MLLTEDNKYNNRIIIMNDTLIQDSFLWNNWSLPLAFFNSSIPLQILLNSSDIYDISQYLNSSLKNLSNFTDIPENDLYDLLSKTDAKPPRDSLPLVTTITVFYAFIFIAGVLGNLITCIVISKNKFMHTATNYYLFNLAISDMILLVSGMPPDLFNIWYPVSYPFTDPICILEGILSETSANATVLTITAFTVERYIAICHPFRQHTMSKLSRAVKFILAIWLTAFILAMPQAMQFGVIDQKGGKLCSVKDNYIGHVFAVSGFVFFVGPMTAICVLYVLIGVKLKKSKLLHSVKRKGCDMNNRGMSAQTRVIRMLVAVAVAFFLCWAPFHAQRLMAVYGSTVETTSILFEDIYTVLTYTSGVLYFLSTCINPLLYNIMSYKFRDAFKITLARQFGLGSGNYQLQNHNYSGILRQNGSIRLTTVTNNRPNNCNNSLAELHKRESDLSLQDGLRTNRSSHRYRCISISSQSTLLTSLSKNDVYNNTTSPMVRCNDLMSTIDDNSISDSQRIQEIPLLRKHRNSISVATNDLKSSNDLTTTTTTTTTITNNNNNSHNNNGNVRHHSIVSTNHNTSSDSSEISPMTVFSPYNNKFSNKDRPLYCHNVSNVENNIIPNTHNSSSNHNHKFNHDNNIEKKRNDSISQNSNDTKLSALENLSQKLRRGTRKVFFHKNNNIVVGMNTTSSSSSPTTTTTTTAATATTTIPLSHIKHQVNDNSQIKQKINLNPCDGIEVKSINFDIR